MNIKDLTVDQFKQAVFLLQFTLMGDKTFNELSDECGLDFDIAHLVYQECFPQLSKFIAELELDNTELKTGMENLECINAELSTKLNQLTDSTNKSTNFK